MTAQALYTRHNRALTLLFSDLERYALELGQVFVGTAGSVLLRRNARGFQFYAHQYYDGDGKKRERYLAGPAGDPKAEAKAEALRERIRELKQNVSSLRMLIREGFAAVDRKTFSTLASLHNHSVFQAGGMLIGSHAFGVLLNRLGVRGAPYTTEDIDIARREKLAFSELPQASFLEMLRESGIDFVEVPQFDRRAPSTSFKQKGRSQFQVDLLVPSPDERFGVLPVPELQAHATGLPYLAYVLGESQTGMLIAREGVCPVRLPLPERFAIHKFVVSRLRGSSDPKTRKDVHQACVLAAILAEDFPGALESAIEALPKSAGGHLNRALDAAKPLLETSHPRAWEELGGGR